MKTRDFAEAAGWGALVGVVGVAHGVVQRNLGVVHDVLGVFLVVGLIWLWVIVSALLARAFR